MDDRETREERYKKRTRQRNKIEKDLLNQLGDNKNNSHYTELIKDYLFMWDTMQELKLDIKERGVSVFWQNSETQFGYKKNDSIREMTTVSNQMLKILNDLDLKPSKAEEVDEDDEILL
jgi:phage terminase small subunit